MTTLRILLLLAAGALVVAAALGVGAWPPLARFAFAVVWFGLVAWAAGWGGKK